MKSGSIFLICVLVIVSIVSLIFPVAVESFSGMSASYGEVGTGAAVDSNVPYLIDPGQSGCTSVGQMGGGMFCSPSVNQMNDTIAGSPGSMSCKGLGLTTNGGNVCVPDSTFKLLTSRGGNA